ncbi:MAG: Fe2+-dependent dioxygenase [Hydrogenophilaceae bacterium]|jgi:PKHD-type hydroxylase|nr:Fe2+-dependent dioxygenase [Hydrogenophilaceae bacterium]
MFLEVKALLADSQLARLRQLAQAMRFVDGRATNEGFDHKRNLQADPADAAAAEASKLLAQAMASSRAFTDFAIPRRIAPPLLARYEAGMKYGPHADAAFMAMAGARRLRSDVSCTVFLSDPSAYEGGELTLHLGVRALPIKPAAGSAILYPSTTLHEVAPVRAGVRLVALTFIESEIPDEQERAMVYELGEISALEGDAMNWVNRMRLEVVRQNLLRKWSR